MFYITGLTDILVSSPFHILLWCIYYIDRGKNFQSINGWGNSGTTGADKAPSLGSIALGWINIADKLFIWLEKNIIQY